MNRLGQPAPQPPRATGAARFAKSAVSDVDAKPTAEKSQNTRLRTQPASVEKERTTLYLPLDVQERFADLRRQLRRRGIKPRDASNSALVARVFRGMADGDLVAIFIGDSEDRDA